MTPSQVQLQLTELSATGTGIPNHRWLKPGTSILRAESPLPKRPRRYSLPLLSHNKHGPSEKAKVCNLSSDEIITPSHKTTSIYKPRSSENRAAPPPKEIISRRTLLPASILTSSQTNSQQTEISKSTTERLQRPPNRSSLLPSSVPSLKRPIIKSSKSSKHCSLSTNNSQERRHSLSHLHISTGFIIEKPLSNSTLMSANNDQREEKENLSSPSYPYPYPSFSTKSSIAQCTLSTYQDKLARIYESPQQVTREPYYQIYANTPSRPSIYLSPNSSLVALPPIAEPYTYTYSIYSPTPSSSPTSQSPTSPLFEIEYSKDFNSDTTPLLLGPYLGDDRLGWNVLHKPSTIHYRSSVPHDHSPYHSLDVPHHGTLESEFLFESAATTPGVRDIEIRFEDEVLAGWAIKWGPLFVCGGCSASRECTSSSSESESEIEIEEITIRDVLEAIYSYFYTPLKEGEYASLNVHSLSAILTSYNTRVGIPSYPKVISHDLESSRYSFLDTFRECGIGMQTQISGPVRRVDVLGVHTLFRGLRLVLGNDLNALAPNGRCTMEKPYLKLKMFGFA